MKKSVVIVIALIYVAAIALVSFLGLKPKTYNDNVYVESITVTADHDIKMSKGEETIRIVNNCREDPTPRTIQLYCEVKPDNATNPKINYTIAKEDLFAKVDENGLVTITDKGTWTFYVYISSAENPSISKKIKITAVDQSEYE